MYNISDEMIALLKSKTLKESGNMCFELDTATVLPEDYWVFGAYSDKELAGWILMNHCKKWKTDKFLPYINIFVSKKYRKQGIGKKLMKKVSLKKTLGKCLMRHFQITDPL